MDILFSTPKLQKLCNSLKLATRKLGADAAGKLIRRLRDLRVAVCLEHMRQHAGRCEELRGDRNGQFSMRLTKGLRLIFEPGNDPIPRKEDGGLDWAAVTIVRILEVEDYHD